MKKLLILTSLCVFLLTTINCQKKKDEGCAEDFACSFLLLSALRTGTITITGSERALNNVRRYTVNLFNNATCAGSPVRTTTFYEDLTPNVLNVAYSDMSSGSYTVQATAGSTSICSNSASIGAVQSSILCSISGTSIICR